MDNRGIQTVAAIGSSVIFKRSKNYESSGENKLFSKTVIMPYNSCVRMKHFRQALLFSLLCAAIESVHHEGNLARVGMALMNGWDYKFPAVPVIYVDEEKSNGNLVSIVNRNNLLLNHGEQRVKLSSSNTYSHGLRISSLAEYITEWVDIDLATDSFQSTFAGANESFYLFGNNYDGIFKTVNDLYVTPPCRYCDVAGAKTIGIGGKNSGVSFHFHAEGFSEPIIGRKQWFLFPVELTTLVSKFSPNMTVYQWTQEIFPKLLSLRNANSSNAFDNVTASSDQKLEISVESLGALFSTGGESESLFTPAEWMKLANSLYHCTIEPGEVLFFPSHWMHATLNLDDYNVFYSLFIDVQLMK